MSRRSTAKTWSERLVTKDYLKLMFLTPYGEPRFDALPATMGVRWVTLPESFRALRADAEKFIITKYYPALLRHRRHLQTHHEDAMAMILDSDNPPETLLQHFDDCVAVVLTICPTGLQYPKDDAEALNLLLSGHSSHLDGLLATNNDYATTQGDLSEQLGSRISFVVPKRPSRSSSFVTRHHFYLEVAPRPRLFVRELKHSYGKGTKFR
ncbi:MAG: hypothetical protein A49_11790 [Methyloceanibacter sp.]|nr:MAG: hypothetical protein A49_11790 [Methyloceanibacter sp.]